MGNMVDAQRVYTDNERAMLVELAELRNEIKRQACLLEAAQHIVMTSEGGGLRWGSSESLSTIVPSKPKHRKKSAVQPREHRGEDAEAIIEATLNAHQSAQNKFPSFAYVSLRSEPVQKAETDGSTSLKSLGEEAKVMQIF